MINKHQMETLHEKLETRRKALIDARQDLNTRWQELETPEVELEEVAQRSSLSEDFEQLDEQDTEELASIDRSLARMEDGTYGVCLRCGKDISFKRLGIIPYTDLCSQCALKNAQEKGCPVGSITSTVSEEGPPIDDQGLSDEEVVEAIYDALERDGRVPLEELEITCRAGTVYLNGAVPAERQHQVLLQVVQDVMGLDDVIDDVRIDSLLWQRPDRTQGLMEHEKTDPERMMEGEDVDEDTFQARKAGTSVAPPGELVPEKET